MDEDLEVGVDIVEVVEVMEVISEIVLEHIPFRIVGLFFGFVQASVQS